MVKKAVRPPASRRSRDALSTESLARSQHSTSVCTTASKLPGWKGSARALDATAATRSASCSVSARATARRSPSSGTSLRTVAQPDRAARYSPGHPHPDPRSRRSHARPEMQQLGEQVGLSHRRVAVDSPVGTDDGPLDLAHHVGPILAVAIAELLPRVVFLTGSHAGSESPGARDCDHAGRAA